MAKRQSSAAVRQEPRASRDAPYRRAQRDRGAETRARLIDAALTVFGRVGFEGATTREIAKAAEANLAAIVYHFGSKEALHRAVAEHVVAEMAGHVAGPLASVEEQLDTLDPDGARDALVRLIGVFVDVILGTDDAERWARFIVREQLDPTASFDVMYGFMGNAHAIATRLVATALGGNVDEEEAKLRAFMILGQVMVFRVAQAAVLRRLGRRRLGATDRDEIKRLVSEHILAILDHRSASDASD